jgi:hypothetical protein
VLKGKDFLPRILHLGKISFETWKQNENIFRKAKPERICHWQTCTIRHFKTSSPSVNIW